MGSSLQNATMPTAAIDAQIAAVARDAAAQAQKPLVIVPPPEARERPVAGYRTLAVTWLLCIGLTFLNLEGGGLFAPVEQEIDPAALVAGLEIAAELDAIRVEAYLAKHGVLPHTLSEIGLTDDDPAVRYERIDGETFRVIARHDGHEGIFDSRVAAQERAAEAERQAAEAARRLAEAEQRAAEAEAWLAEAGRWNVPSAAEERIR